MLTKQRKSLDRDINIFGQVASRHTISAQSICTIQRLAEQLTPAPHFGNELRPSNICQKLSDRMMSS